LTLSSRDGRETDKKRGHDALKTRGECRDLEFTSRDGATGRVRKKNWNWKDPWEAGGKYPFIEGRNARNQIRRKMGRLGPTRWGTEKKEGCRTKRGRNTTGVEVMKAGKR